MNSYLKLVSLYCSNKSQKQHWEHCRLLGWGNGPGFESGISHNTKLWAQAESLCMYTGRKGNITLRPNKNKEKTCSIRSRSHTPTSSYWMEPKLPQINGSSPQLLYTKILVKDQLLKSTNTRSYWTVIKFIDKCELLVFKQGLWIWFCIHLIRILLFFSVRIRIQLYKTAVWL